MIVTEPSATVEGFQKAGRAFVYRKTDRDWRGTDTLTPEAPREKGAFGTRIAADGGAAFISATGERSGDARGSGAVYVYRLEEGSWQANQRLEPDNPFEDDIFGSSVAIDGDRAVVGNDGSSTGDDETIDKVGDVSVYRRSDATWTRTELFRLEECPGYSTELGSAIDLSGDTWTTHLFELVPDADGDGVPDAEDENPMSADGETSLPDCESDIPDGGCGGCGAPAPYGPMMVILIVFGVRAKRDKPRRRPRRRS